MKNKAVILGANYYIGLSAIRCLGRNDVHVVAVDYSEKGSYALKSKYIDEKLIGPHYKKDTENFIKFLIDYGKKQDSKPVLLPSADPYVEVVDEYMDKLRKYYLFPKIKKGLLTEIINKRSLEKLAKKHNVLIPETLRTNIDNFYKRVKDEIGYPCLVKPINSHQFVSTFRRKMFKVYSKDELNKVLEKVDEKGFEVIVQRLIKGFDDHMYTYDAYLDDDSKVTHSLTCQKQRQYPINFGASVYTKQVNIDEIKEIGQKFLQEIGYKGFAEIEFKKDKETGNFYLIEINVRFSNLNVLLNKVGLNMPFITYKEAIGEEIGTKYIEKSTNVHFIYLYEDLLAIRNYLKTDQLKITDVIKSYFNKKAYAIFSLDDIKPYFSFNKKIIKSIVKKIRR
ncbi:MAG: carboxylate--amine ligase [Bacillota bacterium]